MDSFLGNVGLMAICFLITYCYKKVLEHYELKRSSFYEDEKVYKAAGEFAHGASINDIKAILANCAFDKEDVRKILSRSASHRNDRDGGYRGFIRSVNKVLGEDIYSEQYYKH